MRLLARLPFRIDRVDATGRPTLIDRYAGRNDHAVRVSCRTEAVPFALGIALVDTTRDTHAVRNGPGEAAIWHVLWVREEQDASVAVSGPGDEARWPIAPGDSVAVPPGGVLRAAGGQLAIAITVPATDTSLAAPAHGTERYVGYNRQTVAFQIGGIRLCRWKLTQPLALAEHHPAPLVMLALARDSVIRTASTIDRLTQGQAALVDPAASPIVTPDGLAYLLTVERF